MVFYFRKLEVHGVANVPKDKPVLFLANHQNALLDALLIAGKCGRFSYFLTRAAVFKKSLVSKILKSLQMLPVYRIRDGWNTLTNNNAIFETCSNLLSKNEAVVIFPEGSHNLVRRVRPLSKGFTRIVFDTLEKYPDLDLKLVPVGLNFIDATRYPDSTAIFFGEPIDAKDFINMNRAEGVITLKKKVHAELAKLTTHIHEENYSQKLQFLFDYNIDLLDPSKANDCLENNFENCIAPTKTKRLVFKKLTKTLLILNLFIPYLVWKIGVQPKVKEPEFISTFRFAIALTLVPIYLIIITVLIGFAFGAIMGWAYLALSLLLALLTVRV